jgi:thiol-disulfide isomerase/thioredoxin
MRAFITSCISALTLVACSGPPDFDPTSAHVPAPTLKLAPLEGSPFADLATLCGRVVQLEFWGSWCGPCERSLPAADRLRDQLRRQDFEVLAIALDADAETARAFVRAHRVGFPLAWDPVQDSLRAFDIEGVPTTVLLDRAGRVRERIEGFNDAIEARIRDSVHKLMRERSETTCSRETEASRRPAA